MKYYIAPMGGLIGYIYRNTYRVCYHPMDKYFTPFPSPKVNNSLSFRGLSDILPGHDQGIYVVPQILTNQTEDFVRIVKELQEYGYSEVNPNLGRPSGAVVSKYRGTGFLRLSDNLDRFLDKACGKTEGIGIELSIRMRLELAPPDKFTDLLEIYNRYPLKELTLHLRVRADYYKNTPSMPVFGNGFNDSRAPVCYNGDIFTVSGYETLCGDHPELDRVMLGRGIISNPGLLDRIAAGANSGEAGTGKGTLRRFHQMIYEDHRIIMSGGRNILSKMEELWTCMIQIFSDNGKYTKRIRKSQRLEEYEVTAAAVSRNPDIMEGVGFRMY